MPMTPLNARVSIAAQMLEVLDAQGDCVFRCRVNTAKNGVGCVQDSGCTPLGRHYIRAHIGEGLPAYAVLKARRFTGEIWTPALAAAQPNRDWILGRILWLSGCESGMNRGGRVDTFRRYVYIHGGAPWSDDDPPLSHGCIRVEPRNMLTLARLLQYTSQVDIQLNFEEVK